MIESNVLMSTKYLQFAKNVHWRATRIHFIGPTLFSLYVNDLPSTSDFETRLFADDTVLIMNDVCLSSLESKGNTEIIKVEKWL